jgi:hydroxyethylthiazole kinase-like uncharacterized protein yjeF
MRPVTSQEMADIDRAAIEKYGVSQHVLMENAGRSVAEVLCADIGDLSDVSMSILCGRGNNGGDGFVAARYLMDKPSRRITVYVTESEKIKPGAAKDNFTKISCSGIEIRPVGELVAIESNRVGPSFFVDALFGTGFRGALPRTYLEIAEWAFKAKIKVYSVDVPSGLDSTTGEARGGSFTAYKTVALGLPKKGFYTGKGPELCGEIIVADIGIPDELLERYL